MSEPEAEFGGLRRRSDDEYGRGGFWSDLKQTMDNMSRVSERVDRLTAELEILVKALKEGGLVFSLKPRA